MLAFRAMPDKLPAVGVTPNSPTVVMLGVSLEPLPSAALQSVEALIVAVAVLNMFCACAASAPDNRSMQVNRETIRAGWFFIK